MRQGLKHKSEESKQREKAHQFGQPNGNKPCPLNTANEMRNFYRWAENASQAEVEAFMADKTKPYFKRKFLQTMIQANRPQDYFDLTNQTHGMPKQVIEQTDLPEIKIVLE